MTHLLRAIALAIAVAGAIDPAFTVRRPGPINVELRTDGSPAAESLRDALQQKLPRHVAVNASAARQAVIVIGDRLPSPAIEAGVPISVIIPGPPPNVRVDPRLGVLKLAAGQSTTVSATVEGRGVAGRMSVIALHQSGVELARVEHTWKTDGAAAIDLPYVPASTGRHALRIVAVPLDDETRTDDNAADGVVDVASRRLRVLVHESRPSWAAGFVRRALEADPAFAVSTRQQSSRGIETESGAPPPALSAGALDVFDLVIVGAPEDLSAREASVLEAYAHERGGTVAFLPDRRPSGPYVSLLGSRDYQEVLLDRPAALTTGGAAALRASELVVPRDASPSAVALARTKDDAPVIVSWPAGDGRVIYSGALDAWRFRGDEGNGFGEFWRRTAAAAALASPSAIEVMLDPAVVAPSMPVRILAKIRRTEYRRGGDPRAVEMPAVSGAVIDAGGGASTVRLWPASEPGSFHGLFTPIEPGRYTVRLDLDGGASSELTFVVDPEASRHGLPDEPFLRALTAATGGVLTAGADFAPLLMHLDGIAMDDHAVEAHPMRSAWWIVPFAGVLCAEWAARRKRGLR
jgi:hypothetical protein